MNKPKKPSCPKKPCILSQHDFYIENGYLCKNISNEFILSTHRNVDNYFYTVNNKEILESPELLQKLIKMAEESGNINRFYFNINSYGDDIEIDLLLELVRSQQEIEQEEKEYNDKMKIYQEKYAVFQEAMKQYNKDLKAYRIKDDIDEKEKRAKELREELAQLEKDLK